MNAHALLTAGISTSNIAKLLGVCALTLALGGCRGGFAGPINASDAQCQAHGLNGATITLAPSSLQAGSPEPVTIQISGDFGTGQPYQLHAADSIAWNGSANGIGTAYVDRSHLTMTVSADVLDTAGTSAQISVKEQCATGPDPLSQTNAATLTITFGIITTSLPDGVVGTAYNQALSAAAGKLPYTWSIKSGALPAGLALDAAGVIHGTPSAAGTSNFTVQVTDSSSKSVKSSKALSIVIANARIPVSITTAALPNGTVGVAYNQSVTATGGTPAYQWTWKPNPGSSLPPGLNIDSNTGAIHGIPTNAGTFHFTVFVLDHSLPIQNASQSFSLTISPAQQLGYSPGPVLSGSAPGPGLLVAVDQGVNAGDGNHGVAAVAVNGTVIAAGAPFGSVFLRDTTGSWAAPGKPATATANLAAPAATTGTVLSIAISGDGNTIAAGFCEQSPCGRHVVYVYVVENNNWSGTLTPSSILTATSRGQPAGAALGFSVAVDDAGDVIAAGAPSSLTQNGPGMVSVFTRSNGAWLKTQPDGVQLTAGVPDVGVSVAIDGKGETIVTGAEGFGTVVNAGAAYIFAKPQKGWAVNDVISTPTATMTQTSQALNTTATLGDYFGRSVSISSDGHTIAVGAPHYKNDCTEPCNKSGPGAVFVYLNNGAPSAWPSGQPIPEIAVLTASNGMVGDQLGFSASISQDGSTIVAGAPSAPNGSCCTPGPGAIYVFQAPAGTWSGSRHERQTFVATADAGATPSQFGTSVSIAGDATIVGAGGTAVINGTASQFVDLFQ
jgi:hypothetical protein